MNTLRKYSETLNEVYYFPCSLSFFCVWMYFKECIWFYFSGFSLPFFFSCQARRKEVFIQERYGRFNLSDPFLALQRDFEAGACDKEKKPLCMNPLSILEAVMAHCRKMQERMSAQLAAAENRQKKVSYY